MDSNSSPIMIIVSLSNRKMVVKSNQLYIMPNDPSSESQYEQNLPHEWIDSGTVRPCRSLLNLLKLDVGSAHILSTFV